MNLSKGPRLSKYLETLHNLHLQHQSNALCHCVPEAQNRGLKVLLFESFKIMPDKTWENIRDKIVVPCGKAENMNYNSSFPSLGMENSLNFHPYILSLQHLRFSYWDLKRTF